MIKFSYVKFSRKKWASFQDLKFSIKKNMQILKKIHSELSIKELKEIYLPLSQFLIFYIKYYWNFHSFLKKNKSKIPYIISIAGSISVGKSTTALILKKLLSYFSKFHRIEIIATDSFLHSNKILKKKGLMEKKGFPQSYDISRLINLIADLKSGISEVITPLYSHINYDILDTRKKIIKNPDILILEGLNVLQKNYSKHLNKRFISDFVDFSIYMDAPEKLLKNWFVDRFLKFRKSAFHNPNSYFYPYSKISKKRAIIIAIKFWKKINWLNVRKNILPTRERADMIIKKSTNHFVKYIKIRK